MKYIITVLLLLHTVCGIAQMPGIYWNKNTQIIPWRITPAVTDVTYLDLDKDGDPDVLKAKLDGKISIMWIDDDDDMKAGDQEGDTDSDCLLIDRNGDGIFAGPMDFSIDWCDEDGDGKADLQLIVNNAGLGVRNFYDWGADYMYVLDDDHDNIMHFVDWNKIMMQAWEHNGHANFFTDYHGNSTFMKMHASSFRINDLRYSWENPFIFYDTDNDKLTEMAIRLVNTPTFRGSDDKAFARIDKARDIDFSHRIDYAAITWDLDNDNGPGNEFDFDMSLLFKGKGFNYEDQVHNFKSLRGLPAADRFFYDKRWRKLNQLVYPGRDTAYNMIFNKGDWQECRLVFDEDDDCNRWERVEFYDPLDVFKIGKENGGLDNNKQADAAGDRGEFDMDNSGKGQLYIGAFDGKIHLYGAEWGAWRIDQTAYSYQGFGGQYDRWAKGRLQTEPEKFATVKYTDTDKNGFIDLIEYDLDGDKAFEEQVSLKKLGIDDKASLVNTASTNYSSFKSVFTDVAEKMWSRAQQAILIAKKYHINTDWYSFYQQPHSVQEKYDYGYWLNFYLYRDIRHYAKNYDRALLNTIDKAYYSGNWNLITDVSAAQVRAAYGQVKSNKQFPHLFFNNDDIVRVKNLYAKRDPIITIGYNKLLADADEILKQPILKYGLDDAKLRIPSIHQFAVQLPPLVMMYRLTGDKRYAERAWLQLAEMINYPDWGANRHFLDTGIGGFDFALAYEGLSDYLTATKKNDLRQAVLKNVLLPAASQMRNNAWWHVAHHNWNGICNGGIIMAALAIYNSDPQQMSDIVAMAANGLPDYINAFEPDGQSEEGLMYWGYGLMYTTLAFESMHQVLGTAFGIDETPGFKKTGWFPLFVSGPVASLSIGDDPVKHSRSTSFFWFARRFNDAALAKLQYDLCIENQNVSWADMIFYNPAMVKTKPVQAPRPLDNYVRGIEVMSLRNSWDKNATFVSMHGGSNNANHGHLDAGSFDIQALGEVWAYGDLGRDDYTYPGYFSKETLPAYHDAPTSQTTPGRWHFYRLRAEGKNAVVFNPGTYPDQDVMGEAKVIKSGTTNKEGFYVIDLTSCYNRDVSSYQRGIKFNRAANTITVQDEISAVKPSLLWWGMHTKADISISTDGRTAVMQIGDKKMTAKLERPLNAKFQVLPAAYLPGEEFPLTRNSLNTGFKKLAIKMDNVLKTDICITFQPDDKKPLSTGYQFIPIAGWKGAPNVK